RLVADELASHFETYGVARDGLVFTAPQGGPVRPTLWRRRVWLPALERAGLEGLRLHDLRHTAVAFWIAAGAHVGTIQSLAGHTSAAVVLD
ncbi:MAG: site-specific integrase, partial [Acidimicrobiia bacterium]|nr:site-specific integrase [Acidimicrobiia bacterium]